MARIISIESFAKEKPLTLLMIKTLRAACEKQVKNEPFGQADLDGSFITLVKRSLIDAKTTLHEGHKEVIWYVTKKGINVLYKIDHKASH